MKNFSYRWFFVVFGLLLMLMLNSVQSGLAQNNNSGEQTVAALIAVAQAAAETASAAADFAQTRVEAVSVDQQSEVAMAQIRVDSLSQASEEAQIFASAVVKAASEASTQAEAIAQAAAQANARAQAAVKAVTQAQIQVQAQMEAIAQAAAQANVQAQVSADATALASASAQTKAEAEALKSAEANARSESRAAVAKQARDDAFASAKASAVEVAGARASADMASEAADMASDRVADVEASFTRAQDTKEQQIREVINSEFQCVSVTTTVEGTLGAIVDAIAEASGVASASADAVAGAFGSASASATAAAFAQAEAQAFATAAAQASAEASAEASAAAQAAAQAWAMATAEAQAAAQAIAQAKAEVEAHAEAAAEASAQAEATATAAAQALATAVGEAEASAMAIAQATAEAQAAASALSEALASAMASATAEAQAVSEAAAEAQAAASAATSAEANGDLASVSVQVQNAVTASATAQASAFATANAEVEVKTAVSATADAIAAAMATTQANALATANAFAKAQTNATALANAAAEAQVNATVSAHATATTLADAQASVSVMAQSAAEASALAIANASAEATAMAEAAAEAAAFAAATAETQANAIAKVATNAKASVNLISNVGASTMATLDPQCLKGSCPRLPILNVDAIAFQVEIALDSVSPPNLNQADIRQIEVLINVADSNGSIEQPTFFSQPQLPGESITLTAPAATTVDGQTVVFVEWRRNGVFFSNDPSIKLVLSEQNEDLTSVYAFPQPLTLTVNAKTFVTRGTFEDFVDIPVEIAVSDGSVSFTRTTGFSQALNPGTRIMLSAPEIIGWLGESYEFMEWQRNEALHTSERDTFIELSGPSELMVAVYQLRQVCLPDLVISDINFSPRSPQLNSNVTFEVTITNQGQCDAETFSVSISDSGGTISQSVTGLRAGASTRVSFTRPLTVTRQTFALEVDSSNRVQESNEANNIRSIDIPLPAPSLPDLVVNATFFPTQPCVGESVNFEVTVNNRGTLDVGEVEVSINPSAGGRTLSTLPNLDAGRSRTTQFKRTITGSQTFTITVDPNNRIRESDETNNSITRRVIPRDCGSQSPSDLSWDFGTFKPGVFNIAGRSMPQDVIEVINELGVDELKQTSTTLPSFIGFEVNLESQSGSLLGTFSMGGNHRVVFDLLRGGQKVGTLTVNIDVEGAGDSTSSTPSEIRLTVRAFCACSALVNEDFTELNSVPISISGFGTGQTPFDTTFQQPSVVVLQAPGSLTLGAAKLNFGQWRIGTTLNGSAFLSDNNPVTTTINQTITVFAMYAPESSSADF